MLVKLESFRAAVCTVALIASTAGGLGTAQAWQEHVLYTFTGGADGAGPAAGVVRDDAGNLYGTTFGGGDNSCTFGCGVVFRLAPDGTETVLHTFTGGQTGDGAHPSFGDLHLDPFTHHIYGTTEFGGDNTCYSEGCGTIFDLAPDGTEIVLHRFQGVDGKWPLGRLQMDTQANLYGTASFGGVYDDGVVFKLTPKNRFTVLHSFAGGTDGIYPQSRLRFDDVGNLYGTTGGSYGSSCGTIFKITSKGIETVLHQFTCDADGAFLPAGLAKDRHGNFYGVTEYGGNPDCGSGVTIGCGVVFKLASDNTFSVLHRFSNDANGYEPLAGIIKGKGGILYGTTYSGGKGHGVVFQVKRSGEASTLYSFSGGPDGGQPLSALVQDKDGNLYGTTGYGGAGACAAGCGTVFMLTPDAPAPVRKR